MAEHSQHNKDEQTQFFRKIYLSLYSKGFKRVTKRIIVWEVSWRLNRTATYWPPPTLLAITAFLSCSHELLCWDMVLYSSIFSPTDLNFLSPGLYNNFDAHLLLVSVTPDTQLNPSAVKAIPRHLIDRMHLLFTQVHFLFWQLGQGPICNT